MAKRKQRAASADGTPRRSPEEEARAEIRRGFFRAAEEERWAGVDPADRAYLVKPFGTSPHHGLTSYDGLRLMDIKAATLGYRGCTIQEHDEDKVYEYPGPPGLVAGQQDAERLVAALATEYPRVPFRIELAPFILSQILWEREPVQESDAGAS